jgi:hypothetical protein
MNHGSTDKSTERMTEQEFAELLDHHGGDTARWPPERVGAAERLLASSTAARNALAAARTVDRWLADQRAHRAPAGLAAEVMTRIGHDGATMHIERAPARDPFDRMLDWLTARLWRPVLIGALPAIAGLVIGLASPYTDDADLAGRIGSLAFVDLYAEVHDADQP